MKFRIRRTSNWGVKPCKEAESKELIRIDWCILKTLEEARLPKYKHWADTFFASGTNHREENGMIARDLDQRPVWIININTLEELIKLQNKYGDLILGEEDDWKDIKYFIEIYDGYRE